MTIRYPCKYLLNNSFYYVGGLNIHLDIFHNKEPQSNKNEIIAQGDFGISGLFQPVNLDPEQEEGMVQVNIPAILLPYLRAAITTILSQAGLGTIVFPLINIYEIASKNPSRIIDHTNR